MTKHAEDLHARLENLDRHRRDLSQSLSFMVESNRELTELMADAIEQPRAVEDLRKAAHRQTEKLGACVEQLVTLLAEQQAALSSLRDTLSDLREVPPS